MDWLCLYVTSVLEQDASYLTKKNFQKHQQVINRSLKVSISNKKVTWIELLVINGHRKYKM